MWRALGVEPAERRLFLWGTLALFLIGWADVSTKNASEVFFVKRRGVELLPLVFFASGLLLMATTYAVGRLAARSDRLRLLPLTLAGLGLSLLPLWALVRGEVPGAYGALVVVQKQIISIALLVYFVAMGDLLTGRQAKRLFAPLATGVTLGTMAGSFASDPLADRVGIDGLLGLSAVALLAAGASALPFRRVAPLQLERAGGSATRVVRSAEARRREAAPRVTALWRQSGLFRLLVATALMSGLLGPILYIEFQHVANVATAGADGEKRLLDLYAVLRGWLSVGILVLQLVGASALYRRFGMPRAIAVSPVVYALGFLGLSVSLSLSAGVAALVLVKLQDNAVYDPAMRILFNLFPERMRSRATTFLEGPVKRAGGAAGNLLVFGALQLGTVLWLGYLGLALSALWLAVGVALWRRYPALLIQATALRRRSDGDDSELHRLIDPSTLRGLSAHLLDEDPERCRAAVELVAEAPPGLAVAALAKAARDAPPERRPLYLDALDRVMEERIPERVESPEAARALEELLADGAGLPGLDRANAVQAYGRLTLADGDGDPAVFERAAGDPAPAVRLAVEAARFRRGATAGPDLDAALVGAVSGDDPAARHIAREELRALLLEPLPDEAWSAHLVLLATLLRTSEDRAAAAEAIADVAVRHGARVAPARDAMLGLREDPDPRVVAAVLRFAGHAGLPDQAPLLVRHLTSRDRCTAAAAREGLLALGADACDVLVHAIAFGRRSTRDAVLPIVRELEVEEKALRQHYEREVETIRRVRRAAGRLAGLPDASILLQRLHERMEEGIHTALLLLAAIHRQDRIAELAEHLARGPMAHQRAILVEALEALLEPQEKEDLAALLDDRSDRERRGGPRRRAQELLRELADDSDELTRLFVRELLPRTGGAGGEARPEAGAALARGRDLGEDGGVLSPVQIAFHLKSLPIFERLTTRQLVDLAGVVRELTHPAGTTVVREGDYDDSMFLILEGRVEVRKRGRTLRELGPRDFFGEMAVFEGATRSADIVTSTSTKLLCLERDDLFRLMDELPSIGRSICQTLSRRVRELSEQVRELSEGAGAPAPAPPAVKGG